MRWAPLFVLGATFGYVLQRVGATEYDAIARMFLLDDLHLAGVIGVAVLVAGLGLGWLRRQRGALAGVAAAIVEKPMKPGLVVGAALFGAGWALTGTCPGTALAQLGEGKLMAAFTLVGIFVGTWAYQRCGGVIEARLRRR